ncbi:MAG: ATP-grasp domain-containing protein [Epsilonproteobacteria bacterium]|nr:ATP-grasp domain-containing protein [Campylobacterota bacterium]
MSKKVAVVCATHRDRRELSFERVQGSKSIIFHDVDADLLDHVISQGHAIPENLTAEALYNQVMDLCNTHKIDGVLATDDYPGCLLASHVAHHLGLPAPHVLSVLQCQHKYHARKAQQNIVPHAATGYRLIDPEQDLDQLCLSVSFPLFVKPVKSYFSLYAQSVNDIQELKDLVKRKIPFSFEHFNWFARQHGLEHVPLHHFLAEDHLYGEQCTLEGHSFKGKVTIHGIVDSLMFPGTLSFREFTYPSRLPISVQDAMAEIASAVMSHIGFDNGIFNIEFMFDPTTKKIAIIEINPRMASQFADIFEKVDGTNTYSVLLALATGEEPVYTRKRGSFSCATSYVLRTFQNQRIIAMPTDEDVQQIVSCMSDVRIELFGQQGKTLADQLQDGQSYRYGLINAGAGSRKELEEKIETCKALLPFHFEPVHH